MHKPRMLMKVNFDRLDSNPYIPPGFGPSSIHRFNGSTHKELEKVDNVDLRSHCVPATQDKGAENPTDLSS